MEKETKLIQLDLQFSEMLAQVKHSLMQKSGSLLNSGAIDEESFLMADDFFLKMLVYFSPSETGIRERELIG